MSFQKFHYPVGAEHSLFGARVMSDDCGFVSQLQALEFHLDTSVRLCGDIVAAAHKVFIESQDVKVIDYARVCMLNCYSQVMYNYDAIRVVDPWYLNSVVDSLHGDLVEVDRNIHNKLSSLWELHSNPVSHTSQSSTSSRSLSDEAEKVLRSKGEAYIAKRKAELLQRLDRLQHLSEGMSVPVSTMSDVISTSAASGNHICSSMFSAANICKATVPYDHITVFCSSMHLDIPVVSTQCSSLDES